MLTSDKQQQHVAIEEACATGSNPPQLTGNGDITHQQPNAPPSLSVRYCCPDLLFTIINYYFL